MAAIATREQRVRLMTGLGLSLAMAMIVGVALGRGIEGGGTGGATAASALTSGFMPTALAALAFGLIATGLQLLAARASASGRAAQIDHVRSYATGMVLRLIGVLALAIAWAVNQHAFPPLASAAGYLGTVLPLLYLETRLAR